MNNAFDSIINNQLILKLEPITLPNLIILRRLPCDIYTKDKISLKKIAYEGELFTKEHAKNLLIKGYRYFFIHEEDHDKFIEANKQELLKTSRSLSIGDSTQKVQHQVRLLNQGLKLLYNTPIDDELLQQQHKSVYNLSQFLLNEKNIIKPLYQKNPITAEQYLYQQPLNTSLLLLGLLKYLKTFSAPDMQKLFVTSYLKDIGMAILPKELEYKQDLTPQELSLLNNHAKHSSEILNGRIALNANHLEIIRHHHQFANNQQADITLGLESVLINIIDIFVAMTSPRPYRDALTPYTALEKIKELMLPKYAIEFKYIVHYLKKLLS